VELGIQGFTTAAAHADYVRGRGGAILSLRETRQLGAEGAMARALDLAGQDVDALFTSLDIDSAAQAFAPGCSAPNPDGFSPADLIAIAFAAGRHLRTRYFDLMEINPDFDIDARTARLGAALFLAFLCGYVARPTT
jgi:formiminoglutamase